MEMWYEASQNLRNIEDQNLLENMVSYFLSCVEIWDTQDRGLEINYFK